MMARESRDRADDGLLTLLGDLPELIGNLVKAEIEAAKTWLRRTAKDAGFGGLWFVVALFFLFWAIPVLLTFAIAGISSWWPVWLSALVVLGGLLLVAVVFALLGIIRFKKLTARENPVQAVATDAKLLKEADDDEY